MLLYMFSMVYAVMTFPLGKQHLFLVDGFFYVKGASLSVIGAWCNCHSTVDYHVATNTNNECIVAESCFDILTGGI